MRSAPNTEPARRGMFAASLWALTICGLSAFVALIAIGAVLRSQPSSTHFVGSSPPPRQARAATEARALEPEPLPLPRTTADRWDATPEVASLDEFNALYRAVLREHVAWANVAVRDLLAFNALYRELAKAAFSEPTLSERPEASFWEPQTCASRPTRFVGGCYPRAVTDRLASAGPRTQDALTAIADAR